MTRQRFQMRQLTQIIALVALGIFGGTSNEAGAAEQRCADLGAACVCSEPLQATAYVSVQTSWWDPNDSTTKECNGESALIGDGGAAITRTSTTPLVGTKSTVLASFPAGHSVARYLELGEGHTGTYELGHVLADGTQSERMGARWYQRFSKATDGGGASDYEFANKAVGPCDNSSKWFSVGVNGPSATQWDTRDGANDYPLIYAWGGSSPSTHFTPGLDCCNFGPGFKSASDVASKVTQQMVLGHWYRYEVIIRKFSGAPGLIFEAYRKDVTANLPEEKIIDTTVACVGCGTTQDWTVASGGTTTLTPPARITRPEINFFRNARAGGSCPGSRAYSHALIANWPTDAGQRIGPAKEIEGSLGDSTPPSPPTNLLITTLGAATK